MSVTATHAIEFDEDQHVYRVSGRRLVAVHDVLEKAKILGDVASGFVDDYYLDRGVQTGRACDLFDLGRLNWRTLDPELRGAVEAYARFCREKRPRWLTADEARRLAGPGVIVSAVPGSLEIRVADPALGVAGTMDRLGYIAGPLWNLDLKRGPKQKWHALQTAGYARVLTGSGPRELKQTPERRTFSALWPRRGCLHLPSAGAEDAKVQPHLRDVLDHNRFLAAVALAGYHHE